MTNREGVSFHSDYIPPPPTSSQVSARRVRQARWRGPELSRRIPGGPSATRSGLRVCAGQSLATQSPEDRQNSTVFDTPIGYMKKASEPRFRRSEALSRTRWQVKDSNLRSSRDGFTDQRRQARDQRQCLSPNKLPGVFPTDTRRQSAPTDDSRTPNGQFAVPASCRYVKSRVRPARAAVRPRQSPLWLPSSDP